MRKAFLFLFCVAFIFNFMRGAAFTDIPETVTDTAQKKMEAALFLYDIGVLRGYAVEPGSEPDFGLDDPVTRQEMAMFVARAGTGLVNRFDVGTDFINNLNINLNHFIDLVDPNFYLAILYNTDRNIMQGITPTTFEPLSGVTFKEAVRILVRSLYVDLIEFNNIRNNNYYIDYYQTAAEKGLLKGFESYKCNQMLTRGEIALLLKNYIFTYRYSIIAVHPNQFGDTARGYMPVWEMFNIKKYG